MAKNKKLPQIVKDIRAFKPDEINYAYQKNISFSQLSMYRSCPHKWALQYKDGHKLFSSSIHTVFGTALHHVLQHYLDVMYEKSAAEADREDIIEMFEDALREEYRVQYKKNNSSHFSSSEELREFFEDGIEIIKNFKKKRGSHFNKKGWHLFKIIDIKTSTRGWNDKVKKDEDKQFQLILYKKFFAEQFNIPIENIDIEFFIVKRKVYDHPDYIIPRIQTFTPASGKVKLNKANKALNEFIEATFDRDGFKDKPHTPTPSKWNCTFCPFKDSPELCGVSQ